MVMINRATKEMTIKVVYYGPGLCGKTTNLEFIYEKANPDKKGKLLSVATETDRTLFFDFLPMELGTIKGMKLRVQLYTVPGQVFYDATRRIVLRGSDGVVFVADSQQTMMDANIESVENLKKNLALNSLDSETIPLVFQYNKQDLPDLSSDEELEKALNWRGVPYFTSVATVGTGVNETVKKVIELVIRNLHQREASVKASGQAMAGGKTPPTPVAEAADEAAPPEAEPAAAAPPPEAEPASPETEEARPAGETPAPPAAGAPPPEEPPLPEAPVPGTPPSEPAPVPEFEFSRKGEFDVEEAEPEAGEPEADVRDDAEPVPAGEPAMEGTPGGKPAAVESSAGDAGGEAPADGRVVDVDLEEVEEPLKTAGEPVNADVTQTGMTLPPGAMPEPEVEVELEEVNGEGDDEGDAASSAPEADMEHDDLGLTPDEGLESLDITEEEPASAGQETVEPPEEAPAGEPELEVVDESPPDVEGAEEAGEELEPAPEPPPGEPEAAASAGEAPAADERLEAAQPPPELLAELAAYREALQDASERLMALNAEIEALKGKIADFEGRLGS